MAAVIAAVLLTAGVVGVGSAFQSNGTVPVDGQEHAVTVPVDETRGLWVSSQSRTTCEVRDGASDSPVEVSPVAGEFSVSAGDGETWYAVGTFQPRSDRVVITCSELSP